MTEQEAAEFAAEKAKKEAATAALDAQADAAAKASLDKRRSIPEGCVRVRITKAGNNKVHTGGAPKRAQRDGDREIYEGEDVFPKYKTGDEPVLPKKIAEALEARYFAEIQD